MTALALREPAGPPLLEVQGLVRRYGDRVAVDGLSFAVGRGESFGLLGPNGAGKTTTFHLLAGLVPPHGGTVRWKGRPASPGDRRLRARLGIVFQRPSLDRLLTGRENLALSAALHGISRAEARQRAQDLAERFEIADRLDEPVRTYSGGMRRRLELARALLHRPELVVMDEPTEGLDARGCRALWDALDALRREEGVTLLLTTHRLEDAERCDRVAILDRGRLVACESPAALNARVSGDVITLRAREPEALAAELPGRVGVEGRVVDGQVVIEHPRGHALIPRVIEAFPPGRIESVHLAPPTLADAFLHLTGRALSAGEGGGEER